jgi:hypothetical protein
VAGVLLLLVSLERLREGKRLWLSAPLVLLIGFTVAPNPPGSPWLVWVGTAFGVGVGVLLLSLICRRLGWAVLPGLVAAPALLELLGFLRRPAFVGARMGGVLGVIALLVVVRLWTRALQPSPLPTAEEG